VRERERESESERERVCVYVREIESVMRVSSNFCDLRERERESGCVCV